MTNCKGLHQKDKCKEESLGVVMASTEIGETSNSKVVLVGSKKDTTRVILEKTRT